MYGCEWVELQRGRLSPCSSHLSSPPLVVAPGGGLCCWVCFTIYIHSWTFLFKILILYPSLSKNVLKKCDHFSSLHMIINHFPFENRFLRLTYKVKISTNALYIPVFCFLPLTMCSTPTCFMPPALSPLLFSEEVSNLFLLFYQRGSSGK